MKQNTKDWISYMSAVALIASAIGMAFISFILTMDVGPGPLAYIGEALSAALGLFGFGIYAVKKVDEIRAEVMRNLHRMNAREDTEYQEETCESVTK